jgi:hypothetical protein
MAMSSINTPARVGNRRIESLAPWLSRTVMVPPMLIMTLIGVRYIGNPMHAAAPTGVTLSTPEALTDTRVVGALALTVAFVIAASIVFFRSLRMGHATVIALMAFILAVRILGFAQDGTTLAMGGQRVKTTGEIVFLTLNTLGFAVQTYVRKRTEVAQ